MTDASHPVTQRTIEAFTKSYLRTLGASIREKKQKWRVQLPSHVEFDFLEEDTFDLHLEVREEEIDEGKLVLSPDSRFAQQLLSEVANQFPVGATTFTDDQIEGEYTYPDWIVESDVRVESANFAPYYDRTALCVLVDVSVETVSEYQMDSLEAITIDIDSLNPLPGLTETLLETMFNPESALGESASESSVSEAGVDSISEVLNKAQELALEGVQESLQQTREEATQAAEAEFEEYRQLQEQQLDDVQDEISSVTNRIQELASKIDKVSDQQDRIGLLQQRNDLQSEQQSLEQERDELLKEKRTGYREKREKIFQRHSLEVTTTSVAATIVTYERGELELHLSYRSHSESMRVPYAAGEGVTDSVDCPECGSELNRGNPIQLSRDTVCCNSCQ